MKNKILYIGDAFWGIDYGAPDYVNRELLVERTTQPWSFLINTSPRNTPQRLIKNFPRDIIGHQPGFIVFMLGTELLKQGYLAKDFIEEMKTLLLEIDHNSLAKIIVCTIPAKLFESKPDIYQQMLKVNRWINTTPQAYKHIPAEFNDAVIKFLDDINKNNSNNIRNLLNEKQQLNRLSHAILGKTILHQIL